MALTDVLQLAPVDLLYNFILPFLLVFAIFWGTISTLRIFDNKIRLVISIVVTLFVASTPYFASLATIVAQFGGYTAVIAFGIMLVVGIGMHSYGKTADIYSENMPKWKKLKVIREQKARLRKELQEAKDRGEKEKIHSIYEQLKRLEEEEDVTLHTK